MSKHIRMSCAGRTCLVVRRTVHCFSLSLSPVRSILRYLLFAVSHSIQEYLSKASPVVSPTYEFDTNNTLYITQSISYKIYSLSPVCIFRQEVSANIASFVAIEIVARGGDMGKSIIPDVPYSRRRHSSSCACATACRSLSIDHPNSSTWWSGISPRERRSISSKRWPKR